jgi:pimeloyl-ACP methyl ester carboxylesterase
MVLLHGYTDAGLCWTDLAHEFEKDYDVIMMDYRGHGFSDAPLTGYKTEDYTADAVGLIEALELQKPIIIGHSMGGSIAARIVLTRPDIPQKQSSSIRRSIQILVCHRSRQTKSPHVV